MKKLHRNHGALCIRIGAIEIIVPGSVMLHALLLAALLFPLASLYLLMHWPQPAAFVVESAKDR